MIGDSIQKLYNWDVHTQASLANAGIVLQLLVENME